MCFSATASFVAGTSLSAIGVATIRKAERRSELPFAMIPLLFGIQQLVEGIIWLTFRYDAPVLKPANSPVCAFSLSPTPRPPWRVASGRHAIRV